jgi:DNA-directed RNA polymerase subunit N (RpoN/RPB10)
MAETFPVCCFTCRKVINPLYDPFRAGVRKVQCDAAKQGLSEQEQRDRVAGVLSGLGIHNLCCRILFLSHVDTHLDELAVRGEQLGDAVFARTPGEIAGTVRIIREPRYGRRKPSVLMAR